MQHLQQLVEEVEGGVISLGVDGLLLSVDVGGLHHLQIPAGELVPEELIDSHQGLRDTILGEEIVEFGSHLFQFSVEPFHGQLLCTGLFDIVADLPALDEAEGVPDFIVEVTSLLAESLVEEDVVTGRSGEHHAHAHTVGSELLDEFDGVGAVAERLRHLTTQLVADNTCEVDVLEGELAHILLTGHDHACYPEEDDVGSRHEV